MRKLGIIGGTSWSSTALYYEHINQGIAQRLGGFHSAQLTIESVDFADLISLEDANDWDGVAKLNIDAAQKLQAAGAEGVLIACNTTHKVYDAVAANIDVPVLHIADAAGDKLVLPARLPHSASTNEGATYIMGIRTLVPFDEHILPAK